MFHPSLARRAPSAVPLGGRAVLSHALPGLCKVLNTARLSQQMLSGMHRQNLFSNSLIIKIPGRSSV